MPSIQRAEKLSVVTTLFNSRAYVQEFYDRACASAKKCAFTDVEIVFVDDCCPENSHEIVREICAQDEKVKLIKLAKNAGHHHAMMCGMDAANGDLVFLIDVDLEEKPEYLSDFVQEYDLQDSDVVFGIQKQRKGNFFEVFIGRLYWKAMATFKLHATPNMTVMKLQSRRYIKALVNHWNANLVMSLSMDSTGFKTSSIPVDKGDTSPTTYTNSIKLKQAIESVVLANSKVFDFFVFLSCVLVFVGFVLVIGALTVWFLGFLQNFSIIFWLINFWLISFMVFLFSFILKILGMILRETKAFPNVVIEEKINFIDD